MPPRIRPCLLYTPPVATADMIRRQETGGTLFMGGPKVPERRFKEAVKVVTSFR